MGFRIISYAGMKRPASASGNSKINTCWIERRLMKDKFVICVDNSEYPASLEKRKVYERVSDQVAEASGQIRVIDESGEDYLYPAECFVSANLADDAQAAVVKAG